MAGSVYEGKTFEEAVRKGLEALRLTRAEAVITTVEEGKGGFLGFGARPYRVSVARRPGGAIREPAERESGERRGRRGGREERGGRDAARGKSGREAHGRGARDERPAREEKAPREERGGRERPARREERVAREDRKVREEVGGREERAPREERAARPERAGRGERGERAERGERGGRDAGRRDAAPVAAAPPAPPAVSDERDDEDGSRKRRRRGRRGGRGRRRGGEPGEAGIAAAEPRAVAPAPRLSEEPSTEAMPGVHATPPVHYTSTPPVMPAAHVEVSAVHTPDEMVSPDAIVSEPDAAPASRRGMAEAARTEAEAAARSEAPDMSSAELVTVSKKLTHEMLRAMGFEPRVEAKAEGNRVDVLVEVERDGELLNGRQGETRQALQHLLNRFLNRGDGSRYHLQLEVNDYWQQRETQLEELARKLAEDAVAQNAEMVTDYLNAQERRIVHVTLRGDERVRTFSLGTGMVKRVAIAPASFPERSEDALEG